MGVVFVDNTTALNAASLNKMVEGDGNTGFSCWGVWIKYNGAAWECSSARGATAQASNLSFNWNTNKLEIDISGITAPFTTAPAVVVSLATGSTDRVEAHATSTDNVDVQFYAYNSATARTTEVTNMTFYMMLFGNIT